MIACHVRYVIDPYKATEFEHYAKLWIDLIERMGGKSLGYFLPSEGANNIALTIFMFPSFALYEEYRTRLYQSEECLAALRYAEETRCIISYERNFFRPLLPSQPN